MICPTAEEFAAALPRAGAIAGLDLGTKTIGVAVSDGLRQVASPLTVIRRTKFTADATALLQIAADRGLAGLAFVDEDAGQTRADALADMTRRWPAAAFIEDGPRTAPHVAHVFDPGQWRAEQPVRLVLIGTDFEVRVWEALLRIPMGRAVTYADIARHIGQPTASRAVGSAVGRNPISFVVPCHRVLRGDGSLGGYHWGLTRKRALIGWETGRLLGRSSPRTSVCMSGQLGLGQDDDRGRSYPRNLRFS